MQRRTPIVAAPEAVERTGLWRTPMAAELEAVHDASVEGTGEMRRCRKMLQEEGAEEGTHLDAAELRSRRPPRSSLSPFLPFLLICSRGGKREVNRYVLRHARFQRNSEPEI